MSIDRELVWDATFPLLRLKGLGSRVFLNGQTSADMLSAIDGDWIKSCWLTASGRIRALFEIRLTPEGADILILVGDIKKVYKEFEKVIFPADKLHLDGHTFIRRLQLLKDLDAKSREFIFREVGDSTMPDEFSKCTVASEDELEYWRIQQGLPSSGEINGETNPFELGLSEWLSLSKGCYLGQETIAKLFNSGGIKQQLRFWKAESQVLGGEQLQAFNLNDNSPNRAGTITSVIKVPGRESYVGLALVRRQFLEQEELLLMGDISRRVELTTPKAFVMPTFRM